LFSRFRPPVLGRGWRGEGKFDF